MHAKDVKRMIYELYGTMHKMAKLLLKKNNRLSNKIKMVDFSANDFDRNDITLITSCESGFINENYYENMPESIKKNEVYPVENFVHSTFDSHYPVSFTKKKVRFRFAKTIDEAFNNWGQFVKASQIPTGYRNGMCHFAGYIKEYQQWCLPSWIWTNAAIVRYYCLNNEFDKARVLGDLIISQQQPCGGWIVRNDYIQDDVIPELAPNDSCYIALNCCLTLYESTHEKKYLESAEKNANWIMETARKDGLVFFGYDVKKKVWIKDRNIVDIGFTAGLFARLYEITCKEEYFQFLQKFVQRYIEVFYISEKKCFATAVDENDKQHGGAFGRGQGWALEGLLPAYRVLKDEQIKQVINDTVQTLLQLQLKDGGWSYNLLNPFMGIDCKAVPVIAKCLVDWYMIGDKDIILLKSAQRALEWCANHTVNEGEVAGGIFSYTIEGAVVHHMYTNTAFVYASTYASEVKILLDKLSE